MTCKPSDCSDTADSVLEPNPDISGIGALVGFVATAYITLGLLILRYVAAPMESLSTTEINPVDQYVLGCLWKVNKRRSLARWASSLSAPVILLSDQQLVTGVAILIGGFSQIKCSLATFHWTMIVSLAWFSAVTHMSALTFLQAYVPDYKSILHLRLPLIFVLVILLIVARYPLANADCTVNEPVLCCFNFPKHSSHLSDTTVYIGGVAISQAALLLMLLSRMVKSYSRSSAFVRKYLRSKPGKYCGMIVRAFHQKAQQSTGCTQGAFLLLHVLSLASLTMVRVVADFLTSLLFDLIFLLLCLVWGTVSLSDMRSSIQFFARNDPKLGTGILDEDFLGFGQWVPVLLLLMPVMSIVDTYSRTTEEIQPQPSLTPSHGHGPRSEVSTTYRDPWKQDSLLLTILLFLINAILVLRQRSASFMLYLLKCISYNPLYWLQITSLFLLPVLHAINHTCNNLLYPSSLSSSRRTRAVSFLFKSTRTHRVCRLAFIISVLVPLFVWDFTQYPNQDTDEMWPTPVFRSIPIYVYLPLLLGLYLPMALACIWVTVRAGEILRDEDRRRSISATE